MKKLLLFLFIGFTAYGQSVEITPGSVLPQMTTAQRTAVSSPKNGMLVFDTNTQSYWFRQSGAWTELPKDGSTANYWQLTGNVIKNTNSGGFWSANPSFVEDNSTNPPTAPVSGAGTRMMWISSRAAFRAGTVDGVNWNADSIGVGSVAFGYNTRASGRQSAAAGFSSRATGTASTAMGYSCIASGFSSTCLGVDSQASGVFSLATGYLNTASGNYSTAMGSFVRTNNREGSFIIGDSFDGATLAVSNAANRFTARFRNGYMLYTDAAATNGIRAYAGATSWSSISDSTKKENFIAANTSTVLHSISQMRVGTWNYKNQDPSMHRHWGVMAQDFYTHFGKDQYGTIGNDTTISTADFDGVAFAAIKGLEERTRQLTERNEQLTISNEQFKTEIDKLKEQISLLHSQNSNLAALNSTLTTQNSGILERLEKLEKQATSP